MTAQYPTNETTLSGSGSLLDPKNNTKVEITADINDSVTTIPTGDTSSLAGEGYLTFTDGTNEIIYYTGKTLNSLTGVTRGADNSNNTAHSDGAELEYRVNVGNRIRQNEEIKAISDDLRNVITADLDDTVSPTTTATSIEDRMDMIANRLKTLGNTTDWRTTPSGTIPYSYLNLADSIVNADINSSAGIDYSKLDLADSILNADINSSAGIALSKLESLTSANIIVGSAGNVPTAVAMSGDISIDNLGATAISSDVIVDADVNSSAGITLSKLASLTADRALQSSSGGVIEVSSVTATELGYLSGATSSIQTQISGNDTDISTLNTDVNMLKPTEQGTPDNTVLVGAGHYVKSDSSGTVTYAGGNSPTFSAVSANSRIDLLTINDSGTLEITTGTEDASPTAPSYPSGKQVLAEVTVDETGTVVINDADIKDVRAFINLGGGSSSALEYRENYTVGTATGNYSGSTTVFDLVGSYTANGKNLRVIYEGVTLTPGVDYTETDANTVTFSYALGTGNLVSFYWSVNTVSTDADTVDGIDASSTPTANTLLALDSNSEFPATVVPDYANYKKPVLVFVDTANVNVENNTGTANQTKIIFPDGDVRSVTEDVTSTDQYRQFRISSTASLTATHDSGLRSGESEANNTWYALYAVKTTDDTSKFVIVGTTTLPTQANFSTLNGYFGTNGWVYLGLIRNGDSVSSNDVILAFKQHKSHTTFTNVHNGNAVATPAYGGINLASTGAGTTITWTYGAGTGDLQLPNNVTIITTDHNVSARTGGFLQISDSTGTNLIEEQTANNIAFSFKVTFDGTIGRQQVSSNSGDNHYINLIGFWDDAL